MDASDPVVRSMLFNGHRARISFRPPWNNADEPKWRIPCGLKLLNIVGIDEYGIPEPEVVPLFADQNSASAVSNDHSVLVPMFIERRFTAGRNCDVANDKISNFFGYPPFACKIYRISDF